MTKRMTKRVVAGVSKEAFEEALSNYANISFKESETLTKLQTEMARINDKYAHELAYLEGKKQCSLEVVEAYCREQKPTLFRKRRSMHTQYGSIGYRLGNPKLSILKGHSWNTVLEKLRTELPAYIRTNEEPAKDLLLADRHTEKLAPILQYIGLEVVQDDIFFIELKPPETQLPGRKRRRITNNQKQLNENSIN